MNDKELFNHTLDYIRRELENAEHGHDYRHALRVWKNAEKISRKEGGNRQVILLASLLHDIADAKFHDGDEEIGPAKAKAFMQSLSLDPETIEHVVQIIRHISFKNSFGKQTFFSRELAIVRDADRLDAMGAVGIARTFHFGGYRNNPIFDPEVPLEPVGNEDEYKKYNRSTIHHFYDKLLKLKDLMHTSEGKKMAEERHAFMEKFLEQFFREWPVDHLENTGGSDNTGGNNG